MNARVNTELCINLKTELRKDVVMEPRRKYYGFLSMDKESDFDLKHFTFVETLPLTRRNNPKIYKGKYVNVSVRTDGSMYPALNYPRYTNDFGFKDLCLKASQELISISGLLEERIK